MSLSAWNHVIENVYAAAAAPNIWPDTLQAIADLLDARGALLLYRHDDGRYGVIVSPTLIDMAQEYEQRWQHLDVRAERVFQAIAIGHRDVQADHMHFTEEEIATLPIYQQFLMPHGICWGMTVPVSPSPAVSVILTVLRAREKPAFCENLQGQLLALSRHVERSLSLSMRLMDVEAERIGLSEALNRLACGVFIIGTERRVLHANQTAEQLLGSGLVLQAGCLRAVDSTVDAALQKQFDAIDTDSPSEATSYKPLIVPSGEHGLIVQVLPRVAPCIVPALHAAIAIVLVENTAGDRPFDPAVVRDAFKLTLGEARLAALVGAGISPNDAAVILGIAYTTARTVLNRVFEKMGVSRQGELAALMGKLFMLRQHQSS